MNRRRYLTILAGTSAAAVAGCGIRRPARAARWRGVLFNAEVDLAIHDLRPEHAERLIGKCVAEMQRLEAVFSLYVPDSVLSTLNREGRVTGAPAEFVDLVEESLRMAEGTRGAFDPTVQPYWLWLREAVEAGRGIDPEEQRRKLALVDYRAVRVQRDEVTFERAGMGMTLNGIAQGWITDRICDLLRREGAKHCLVNLGEFFGLGTQPGGGNWRVGIGTVEGEEVELRERALAVSSGAGHFFGTGAGMNHLIDPRSGGCAEDRRLVAVTARNAATADALSTACAVLGDDEAASLVRSWPEAEVRILHG